MQYFQRISEVYKVVAATIKVVITPPAIPKRLKE